MDSRTGARQRGFTLIEIIVIIVIAGLLGALLVNLLGTQLLRSASPVTTARDAASAEAAMENVVAYYTGRVNTNLTTALADVQAQYAGNSSVSITSSTFNSVPALTVTVTVGQSSLTTLLTQERTSVSDSMANY